MKPYRTTFIDPDYRRDPKTTHYCARCQKDLKPGQPLRIIHQVDGGPYALHPADEALYVDDGGDLGCSPIGSDCARKIGLEWSRADDGSFAATVNARPIDRSAADEAASFAVAALAKATGAA